MRGELRDRHPQELQQLEQADLRVHRRLPESLTKRGVTEHVETSILRRQAWHSIPPAQISVTQERPLGGGRKGRKD